MKALIEVVDTKSFASTVADELVASIGEILDEQETCSLVLAGGSTPSNTYRLLARPPRVNDIDWSKLHIFWGDERWVGKEDNQSNYRMANETFLSQIDIPESNIHPVDTSLASPKDGAKDYEKVINETLGEETFDIVLLGVGEDGHIASLFPKDPALKKKDALTYSVQNPNDGTDRVTISVKSILSAKKVIFLVTGDSKSDVIKTILEEEADPNDYPAKLYEQAEGSVSWFLDSAAAKKLQQ